jgi:hypothetical protein
MCDDTRRERAGPKTDKSLERAKQQWWLKLVRVAADSIDVPSNGHARTVTAISFEKKNQRQPVQSVRYGQLWPASYLQST